MLAVVLVAGTALCLLPFHTDDGVVPSQVYIVSDSFGHCRMASIPCPGGFACVDIVHVRAQADGTYRVGPRVCAMRKILAVALIGTVTLRTCTILGQQPSSLWGGGTIA